MNTLAATLSNIEATQRMDSKADALERGENCLNCEQCSISERCVLDPINGAPRKTKRNWCPKYEHIDWND